MIQTGSSKSGEILAYACNYLLDNQAIYDARLELFPSMYKHLVLLCVYHILGTELQ